MENAPPPSSTPPAVRPSHVPVAPSAETPDPFLPHAFLQAYAMGSEKQRESLKLKYEAYKGQLSLDDVARIEAMMSREDQSLAARKLKEAEEL